VLAPNARKDLQIDLRGLPMGWLSKAQVSYLLPQSGIWAGCHSNDISREWFIGTVRSSRREEDSPRHFQLSFRKVSVSGTDCKFWQSKMAERCNEFGLTIHRGQAQESVAKEQLRKAARGRRSLKLTGSGTVWAYLLFFNNINSAGGTRSSAKPQSRQTKSGWQK